MLIFPYANGCSALLGLLLISTTAAGQPIIDVPLPNGNFAAGLDGWQVQTSPADATPAGEVTVVAGAAQLSKRGAFYVGLQQSFAAPEGLRALRFRIVQEPVFSSSGSFIPEAFEAHVMRAGAGNAAFAWRAGATSSINAGAVPAGAPPSLGAGTTYVNGEVRIPLDGIAAGTSLTFVAAFIGAGADQSGSVRIDDVLLEVQGEPPAEPYSIGSCTVFWNGFEDGFPAPPGPACYIGQVNDTGIGVCADGTTAGYGIACPVADLPGQDAEAGRDALAAADLLGKRGSGRAGFDYTKLDDDGRALPDDAEDWACVVDNVTGLVWERKRDDPADLRHHGHTYSWFEPDVEINGGHPGTPDGGSCQGSACDTLAYVQAVNAEGMCGANIWRLPTRGELMTLIDNGSLDPAIDSSLFPTTPAAAFWSATPLARDGSAAWVVLFGDGSVAVEPASAGHRVRLVRTLP